LGAVSWEAKANAVVVGCGATGAAAAIAAHASGAKVLLLEKAPERLGDGGNRVCGNGTFFRTDVEKPITYLNAMVGNLQG
jgi:glycine/D-amino acid oxidase-like deaminating enzyme